MAKAIPHQITDENASEFLAKLHDLLKDYGAYTENTPVSLHTSNLILHVNKLCSCPPECIRRVHSCDRNGINCRIDEFCEC